MSGEVDLVDNLKKADLIFRRALRCRSENEAIVLLDKALILDPGNANIFAVRSIKLSILGRFPEAIEDYKNAVNLKVETIFRLQAKALIEIYEGNFSESIKLLDEYISEAWSRIVDYESRAKKIFSLWISWEKQYFDEYNLAYALYLRATALYMGHLD